MKTIIATMLVWLVFQQNHEQVVYNQTLKVRDAHCMLKDYYYVMSYRTVKYVSFYRMKSQVENDYCLGQVKEKYGIE
jgi:hypothetical protein